MRWFWQKDKKDDSAGTSRVRLFDFDTKQITNIPVHELAPGMVRARVDGVEGEVWVDASRLQMNAYQHPPFPEEVRDCLRQIKQVLDEVYPMSLEEWEDGFRRDRTPEREIAHWLHLAQVYARMTAPDEGLGKTREQRQAVFKVLVGCGVAPKEQVLLVAERGPLTRAQAEQVINTYFNAGSA